MSNDTEIVNKIESAVALLQNLKNSYGMHRLRNWSLAGSCRKENLTETSFVRQFDACKGDKAKLEALRRKLQANWLVHAVRMSNHQRLQNAFRQAELAFKSDIKGAQNLISKLKKFSASTSVMALDSFRLARAITHAKNLENFLREPFELKKADFTVDYWLLEREEDTAIERIAQTLKTAQGLQTPHFGVRGVFDTNCYGTNAEVLPSSPSSFSQKHYNHDLTKGLEYFTFWLPGQKLEQAAPNCFALASLGESLVQADEKLTGQFFRLTGPNREGWRPIDSFLSRRLHEAKSEQDFTALAQEREQLAAHAYHMHRDYEELFLAALTLSDLRLQTTRLMPAALAETQLLRQTTYRFRNGTETVAAEALHALIIADYQLQRTGANLRTIAKCKELEQHSFYYEDALRVRNAVLDSVSS